MHPLFRFVRLVRLVRFVRLGLPSLPTLILVAAPALCPSLHATLIGRDEFDYFSGIDGAAGGTGWDRRSLPPAINSSVESEWTVGSGAPQVVAGTLVTNNAGLSRAYNGTSTFTGDEEGMGAVNDPTSSPASTENIVYYSVRLTTGATVPDFFGLSSFDFGDERIFFGKNFGESVFGIANYPSGLLANSAVPVLADTSYVLVTKVDYVADTLSLWIDPDFAEPEAANPPDATLDWTQTNWSTRIRLASGAGGPVTWDQLSVATTWEELPQALGSSVTVSTADDEDDGAYYPLSTGGGLSLREAIRHAPPGATISFSQDITLDSPLLVDKELTIEGTGSSSIIRGTANGDDVLDAGEFRCVSIDDGDPITALPVTLRNLTIRDGAADGSGGLIHSLEGLTLSGCRLENGHATFGGGGLYHVANVFNEAELVVTGSEFSSCSANYGGGLYCREAAIELTGCLFDGNRASFNGGGLYLDDITGTISDGRFTQNEAASGGGGATISDSGITLTGTEFDHNVTEFSGGGASVLRSTGTITACAFTFNRAVSDFRNTGGGLFAAEAPDGGLTVSNSLFHGNEATNLTESGVNRNKGGAIMLNEGFLTVSHCTIVDNRAEDGGGIQASGNPAFSTDSSLTLFGCVVRDNLDEDIGRGTVSISGSGGTGTLVSLGSNYVGTGNDLDALVEPGDVLDPATPILLAELGSYGGPTRSRPPLSGSPLVDAAAASPLATDQRGFPRPVDGDFDTTALPDIGAAESTFQVVTTAVDEDNGVDSGAGRSLREAVAAATTNDFIIFDPSLDGAVIGLSTAGGGLGPIEITQGLSIDASMLPNGITIDGNSNLDFTADPGESRCLVIDDGDFSRTIAVQLSHLTLRNGLADNLSGGNLYNREDLWLSDCRFLDGRALGADGTGGGLFNFGADVHMERCHFEGNRTAGQSGHGGAIFHRAGAMTMDSCTVIGNGVEGEFAAGGGIYSGNALLEITGSTVANNEATGAEGQGGGIYFIGNRDEEILVATNTTISANSAPANRGGGLALWSALAELTHLTVVDNSGGGIRLVNTAELLLAASLLRDSLAGDDLFGGSGDVALIQSQGNNFVGSGNGTAALTSAGDVVDGTTPILLAPLGDHGGPTPTRALLLLSPLINLGFGATLEADQRGFPRDGFPDPGAWEWGIADFAPFLGADPDGDGLTTPLELLLLSDPEVSDLGDPDLPAFSLNAQGQPVYQLSVSSRFRGFFNLEVERSLDLDTWEAVYRLEQGLGQSSLPGIDADLGLTQLILVDTDVLDGAAYYRVNATLAE